jgi:Tfp pilus assembly protein PilZ
MVAIGARGGIRQGLTHNVSQGGMFVQMNPPLELGQTYPMTIDVTGCRTMQVEARVVWSVSGGNAEGGTAFGIGVMFTEISKDDQLWLATLVNPSDEVAV